MGGLVIDETRSLAAPAPTRADTPCFVGFVRRRGRPSQAVRTWLAEAGWLEGRPGPWENDDGVNLPIPIESFEEFEQLFRWEERGAPEEPTGVPTWLGLAVKAFFEQGGLRCFVVRVGDSWPLTPPPLEGDIPAKNAAAQARETRFRALLPSSPPSTGDRGTWKGTTVMIGLEEACLLLTPDLPELVADSLREAPATMEAVPEPEGFVTLTPEPAVVSIRLRAPLPVPACSELGYELWYTRLHALILMLERHRPDAILIASLPLSEAGAALEKDPLGFLSRGGQGLAGSVASVPRGIASRQLQLAFPWLLTEWSSACPERLVPPEGFLAGLCAQGVATLGVHHSLARLPLKSALAFKPSLPSSSLTRNFSRPRQPTLADRVSLLGKGPLGPVLLSDVTTSLETSARPAAVVRLAAAVHRAARHEGKSHVFETAGADLRARIVKSLSALLARFHAAGALAGPTEADSFSVRCDATTTSGQDEDNGRLVVSLSFTPAIPVGEIQVTLNLRDGSPQISDTLG